MKEIDKAYWAEYYRFWDDFVKEWFEQRKDGHIEPQDEISKAYKNAVADLVFDELPTPYLGSPRDGIDAVLINLNPGLSEIIRFGEFAGSNSDATQYFSNINKPLGWLIGEFVNKAEGTYSKFIGIDSSINWSCLNPGLLDTAKFPWVCGVDWWQGYRDDVIRKDLRTGRKKNQRMPWIRRIYGRDICPSQVFSLELCPYHSKKFRIDGTERKYQDVILPFIKEYVIDAAVNAVVQNELPFAVAVGSDVAKILTALGAVREKEWSNEDSIDRWPLKYDGRIKERKYQLYTIESSNGQKSRFLVTWAQGGLSAPAEDFSGVEEGIRQHMRNNPL